MAAHLDEIEGGGAPDESPAGGEGPRRLRIAGSVLGAVGDPERLGEHLLDSLDRLGDRVVAGGDPFATTANARIWHFIGQLSWSRLLAKADALGDAFLDALDRLGRAARRRLGLREWDAPVNRIPRLAWIAVGSAAVLVGLVAYAAYGNTQGENDWLTDPGAGSAEAVTPTATSAGSGSTASASATSASAAKSSPAASGSAATAAAGAVRHSGAS